MSTSPWRLGMHALVLSCQCAPNWQGTAFVMRRRKTLWVRVPPLAFEMSVTLDYGRERFSGRAVVREPLTLKEEKRATRRQRYQENRKRRIERMFQYFPNCYYCGVLLHKENRSVDHYVPRSKGGSNDLSNLVTACNDCNQAKGDLEPPFVIEIDRDGIAWRS
ncbi:MAG: HNH endonuclease [Promethearchaeota archaeon]